jgi:hypothetical protein
MLTAPPQRSAIATLAAAPTDVATATPATTPAEVASPTPLPEATTTPSSQGSPASPAAACTGTPQFTDLFAEAAAKEPFDVYCAVLPADYWIQDGNYVLSDGGIVTIHYTNPSGFQLSLEEGNLCASGPSSCAMSVPSSGRIWFGDLGADLYATTMAVAGDAAPQTTYLAFVYAGPGRVYGLTGSGMGKETFANLSAAIVKVAAS